MSTREQLVEAAGLEKFLAVVTEAAAAEKNMHGNGYPPTEERLAVFHFTPDAEDRSQQLLRNIINVSDSDDSLADLKGTHPVLCQDDGILRWKTGIRRYDENGETVEQRPLGDPPPDVLLEGEEWVYMTTPEVLKLWQRNAKAGEPDHDPISPLVINYLEDSSTAKVETPQEKPDGGRGVLQLGLRLKRENSVLQRTLAESPVLPIQGDLLNLTETFSPHPSFIPDIATIHHTRTGGGAPPAAYADRGLWLLGLAVPQDSRRPNAHISLRDPLDGGNQVSVKSLITLIMGEVPRGWRRDVLPKLIEALSQIDRYYHKFEAGKKRKLFSVTEIPDASDAKLQTRVSIHAVMPPNAERKGARVNVFGLIEAGKKSRLIFTAYIKLSYMWDDLAVKHCGSPNGVLLYQMLEKGRERAHKIPILSDYDLIALVTDHDFASSTIMTPSARKTWVARARQAIRKLEEDGYCDIEETVSGWRIYPPASGKNNELPESSG